VQVNIEEQVTGDVLPACGQLTMTCTMWYVQRSIAAW
jgi:hypothetical protein